MNPAIRKVIGVLFILVGVAIAIFFSVNIFNEIMRPSTDPTGQGVLVAFIFGGFGTIMFSAFGATLIFGLKKESSANIENPNNPLICRDCNRDYDRSWKVCMKCGKPLAEK